MHDALSLLDKAIDLGRQELAHLAAGDVDKAEALAFGRDTVLEDALSDQSLAGPTVTSLDSLLAKLTELKDLQARIIDEAKRLKQDIGAQMQRANVEQKRHAGYGRATRPVPRVQSSYISQNG